jgi:stringent starvation protein B
MPERSTKPYLIRAIHEWCTDSGFTPYLSVKVDENTRVPMEFVQNGEIVLNLGYDATHKLTIGNDVVQFSARFSGLSRECSIPMSAVAGIFARENGQGLFFTAETEASADAAASQSAPSASGEPESPPPTTPRPKLQIVK